MTQEEKQLLIKDLCARLPYHLLGRDAFGKTREMKVVYPTGTIIAQEIDGESCSYCGFVPYLRPMSSMTEEEWKEYDWFIKQESDELIRFRNTVKFYNKHHIDYNGLIEKGLALEATEGMYNIKTE